MSLHHFTRSCAAFSLMLSIFKSSLIQACMPGLFGPSNCFSSIDLQIHSSSQNGILSPSFHMSKPSKSVFSAQMIFLLVYIYSAPLHLGFSLPIWYLPCTSTSINHSFLAAVPVFLWLAMFHHHTCTTNITGLMHAWYILLSCSSLECFCWPGVQQFLSIFPSCSYPAYYSISCSGVTAHHIS